MKYNIYYYILLCWIIIIVFCVSVYLYDLCLFLFKYFPSGCIVVQLLNLFWPNHCPYMYLIIIAWLRPPKYFRSIWISLQYYVWVCGMLVGFLHPNFLPPISEQREWLRTMTLKSALVDGHLHARCLVCLQLVRNLIPGKTLTIGYGRSRWVTLGRSNSFKLQQTPAFKWVNVCQLSWSRLSVQMKWSTRVW